MIQCHTDEYDTEDKAADAKPKPTQGKADPTDLGSTLAHASTTIHACICVDASSTKAGSARGLGRRAGRPALLPDERLGTRPAQPGADPPPGPAPWPGSRAPTSLAYPCAR